ncbi:MAG: hypothetical protein CM15mP55_1270 [Hyphomicrobiales bacterium]|nr:MAG: hypothetical protein CM15mP55_1270 [Hyphomicrobiales bacterium]
MARPSVVLPDPLSPTMPNVSPRLTVSEISFTALTWVCARLSKPWRMGNHTLTFSPLTISGGLASNGSGAPLGSAAISFSCRRVQVFKYCVAFVVFNDLALLHDANPVGHFAHHAQIMRDQQNRHAVFALQIPTDLGLFLMVTSSAVVGSSAISRRGLLASAMAIITRWR